MDEETPQSPFLPGTNIQYAWDSTSLGYFKTCPRLYYYHMIEGWSGKGESIHLRFGIEYHSALQNYEIARAEGADHDEAVKITTRLLLEATVDYSFPEEVYGKAARYKSRENLIRTVIWYLDQFENDPAKTHILQNGKPAVELSFRFGLDWGPGFDNSPYLLCGHLDKVVNFNDDLYIMDHKTTTSTPGQYYFDQYEPNNQMSLYTLASQVVLDAPIRGIIIDAVQIALEFSRFTRGFTYRTEDQIQEWVDDLGYWFSIAEGYANNNYWPMNDTACDKFGGCKFRTVCAKSPQVREVFLKSNFEKGEPWNPLKTR